MKTTTQRHDGAYVTVEREMIDVTRLSRADEHWRYVDPAGHVHQWEWPDGERTYRPDMTAHVPTVRRVVTAEGIDEDGYEFEEAHLECLLCGAIVEPGYTADAHRQFIPGPAWIEWGSPFTVSPEVLKDKQAFDAFLKALGPAEAKPDSIVIQEYDIGNAFGDLYTGHVRGTAQLSDSR